MDQRGQTPHENEFWVFSNSEMNVTNRAEKVDENNGFAWIVFMFHSWVEVFKLSKKVHLLQFCADPSKKSKSIKAINI